MIWCNATRDTSVDWQMISNVDSISRKGSRLHIVQKEDFLVAFTKNCEHTDYLDGLLSWEQQHDLINIGS